MGRTCPQATRVGLRRRKHPSGRYDYPTSYPALTPTVVRPLVCQPCRSIQTPSSFPVKFAKGAPLPETGRGDRLLGQLDLFLLCLALLDLATPFSLWAHVAINSYTYLTASLHTVSTHKT
eukprot:2152899-Rhodomonas_salina.2